MAELSQTATNVAPGSGAVTKQGTAGETIAAGMPIYRKTSDGLFYKADADTLATSIVAGIALCGASANQPVIYQIAGQINLGADLTDSGNVLYLSWTTAGAIEKAAPSLQNEYTSIIGVSITTSLCQLVLFNSGVSHN